MKGTVEVSSPGRADFLNTHQDYKGLPVVPVAINLRMHFTAEPVEDGVFTVTSLDLQKMGERSTDSFRVGVNRMQEGRFFGNYLRGVVNVLVRRGLSERLRGMKVTIKSEIPVGSGLSSSAALEVGFAKLLNHACKLGFSKHDLAEVAFAAENREAGIPCGRLDQYGVAFGGIIKLECVPPYSVEPLPFGDLTFAIVDSGIRHSTADIHPKRQEDINRGLGALMESEAVPQPLKSKLGYAFNEPKWEKIGEDEIEDCLSVLDEKARSRILFTLRMQESTEFALKVLRREKIGNAEASQYFGEERWKIVKNESPSELNYRILGEVMNDQQTLLRNLYDVSLPKLEDICQQALDSGAYGAKISGAGLGGSVIALVKDEEDGSRVIDACSRVGAKNGWISKVGEGVKVEQARNQRDI